MMRIIIFQNRQGSIYCSKLMSTIDKQSSPNCELSKKSYQSCPHCADGINPEMARRKQVLQLLALIEHPTALPAESALRIAQELLAWSAHEDANCRREPVVRAEIQLAAVA
jgi:hypothetical protein